MQAKYKEITFSDNDVVNPEEYIPQNDHNPCKVVPWLFHDHGFVVAVVFAVSESEALDEAVDAGKLDSYLIDLTDPCDRDDFLSTEVTPGYDPDVPEFIDDKGVKYWWKPEPAFLGNASEPFDIEGLSILKLPNPPFSFVALFNAAGEEK